MMLKELDVLFTSMPLYSLWNEPYFMCDDGFEDIALSFKREEFADQIRYFEALTAYALTTLKDPSPSRKKRLALRKWVDGHLDFWCNELGRPITIIHDRKDGYSPCHRLLRALLKQIDLDSLGALGPILGERKAILREESASK